MNTDAQMAEAVRAARDAFNKQITLAQASGLKFELSLNHERDHVLDIHVWRPL